jgi:hypothetical protein
VYRVAKPEDALVTHADIRNAASEAERLVLRRAYYRARQATYRETAKFRESWEASLPARRAYEAAYRSRWKFDAMSGYSPDGLPKCGCCGISQIDFLTIDHVNNDGHIERKSKRHAASGNSLYRRIVKENWPSNYQVLCFNCNCAKAFFGVCPHKAAQ